jgi:hypothetical protein
MQENKSAPSYESVKSFYTDFDNYQDIYNRGFWKEYRQIAADMILASSGDGVAEINILDLGGGAMASLPSLLANDSIASYTIVDLVIRVSAELQKMKLIESDIRRFLESYCGPRYDAVVIFGVLEYLNKNDAIEVLRKLPKVMSPRARVVVHEPNTRAERHLEKGKGKQHAIELSTLLQGSGLRMKERRDYHLIWLRRIVNLIPFKVPLFFKLGLAIERYLGGGVDSLYLLELNDPEGSSGGNCDPF